MTENTLNSSYEEMIKTLEQKNTALEKKIDSLRRTTILTGSLAISTALVAPIVAVNWAVVSAALITAAPMIGIVAASLGAMVAVIGMSALVYKNRTAIKESAEKALKNTKDGIVYAAERTVAGAGLLAKKTVDGAVYTKEKIEQGVTSVKETTKRKASNVAYKLANTMYNLSGETDYSEKRQKNFTEGERDSVLELREKLKEAFINDKKDVLAKLVLDTMKLKIMPRLESEIKGLNSELPEDVALINQLKKDKRFIKELDVASLKKFIIENRLPKGNYLFDSICSKYGYEIQKTIDMHNEGNLAEKEAYREGSAKLKNELKEAFDKTEEKVIKSFLNEMKSQIVKELKSDIKTIEYEMKHGSIPKGDDTTLRKLKTNKRFIQKLNVESLQSLVTGAKNDDRFDAILCECGDGIKEIMSNTQPGLFHNNSLYIGVTSSDDRSNDDHSSNPLKFADVMDSVMSELNLVREIEIELEALERGKTPLSRSNYVDSTDSFKTGHNNIKETDSGVGSNIPSSCSSDEDLVRSSSSDLSKKAKITRSASCNSLNDDTSQDSSRSRSNSVNSIHSVSGGTALPTKVMLTEEDGSMKSQYGSRKTDLRKKSVESRIGSQIALNVNSVTHLGGNIIT